MNPIYLGVDVAGKANTWIAALTPVGSNLEMVFQPRKTSLSDILTLCEQNDVVAVAIDAQLTIALSNENGFRSSDIELRDMLPDDCRNWVASINSLVAAPVRGMMLAEALSPVVGTLLGLQQNASARTGRGPFYVTAPGLECE